MQASSLESNQGLDSKSNSDFKIKSRTDSESSFMPGLDLKLGSDLNGKPRSVSKLGSVSERKVESESKSFLNTNPKFQLGSNKEQNSNSKFRSKPKSELKSKKKQKVNSKTPSFSKILPGSLLNSVAKEVLVPISGTLSDYKLKQPPNIKQPFSPYSNSNNRQKSISGSDVQIKRKDCLKQACIRFLKKATKSRSIFED